jgi:ABC-2 type transport system ATP-binding protein
MSSKTLNGFPGGRVCDPQRDRATLPRMAILEAVGLDKRFGRTWALRGVSFELRPGVTALVGPNGAGKSTFMRLCLGFERPTAGRVLVSGCDPQRDRTAAVGSIGYVPQSPSLYRELSVADHVRLASQLRPGFDEAGSARRLEELAIPSSFRPGQLSGGQAAQVWLAIALGTRAPLLLLDEPLANLDPLARREFLGVVADAVSRDGVTVLLSSHVIGDVEPIAGRLLLLGEGEILLHDPIAAIREAHRVVPAETRSIADLGVASRAGASAAQLVATFPDRAGRPQRLMRQPADASGVPALGEPASLEEIVLGYLSSLRPGRTGAVAGASVPVDPAAALR